MNDILNLSNLFSTNPTFQKMTFLQIIYIIILKMEMEV